MLIEKEINLNEELNKIKFELSSDEDFDWDIAFNMIDIEQSGFINQQNLNEFLRRKIFPFDYINNNFDETSFFGELESI